MLYTPQTFTHGLALIQVMLLGPPGSLVLVVVLVGRKALLWPPGNARVHHSAVLEREPALKTAQVLLVTREWLSASYFGLR